MTPQKTKFKQTEIGLIPEEWEVKRLNQIAEFIRGFSYKGSEKRTTNGEYIFITLNSVKEGGGFKKEFSYITTDRVKDRHFIDKGQIFIANTEQTKTGTLLGSPALVEFPVGYTKNKGVFSHHITKVNLKVELEKYYVYYFLIFNQKNAVQYNTGSVIWALDVDNWSRNEKIPLPPLPEQRAIAKILSDLDAKIELNQQMNKTLEAIGQALFKHWFVDFEFPNEEGKPYKSSGGEMVYNEELGKEIPEGWRVGRLGEFISFEKGRKPTQVFDFCQDGLLPQILIEVLDGGSCGFANTENMIISNENDIIMVMDGASSGRCERGFLGILGSTLAKIVIKDLGQNFIYYFLKDRENDIKENTTGTSIPHADKGRIEKYQIIIPSQDILNKFNDIIDNLFLRQILARKQSLTLSRIRDALLPKLMSGKIHVPVDEILNGENL